MDAVEPPTASPEICKLMIACQKNNYEEVKELLDKGEDIHETDSSKRSVIFYCTENKTLECLELILKAGADPNHQDKDGCSCLHLAVMYGNLPVVKYLIENGADMNMADYEMHSVVQWSVVCNQLEVLEYLLEKNADPETADIYGAYAIHYASMVSKMSDENETHIDSISQNMGEVLVKDKARSLDILKRLIDQKVKIDAEDFDQRNAFIWAASDGSYEALAMLFKSGADPNKHEKDGLTALHCASSRGHVDCIDLLVNTCQCSVDIMDNSNCTPIFYAATLGQEEATQRLISLGANLHVQDYKGRSAYHCSAAKGQLKTLKVLCEANPNIWLRNRRGDFPIHEAYYNQQMECVYYLIDTIANKRGVLSANSYDGLTLLHLAASDNDLNLCIKLVESGIDVNCLLKISTNMFMTAYDIAKLKESVECEEYLRRIGGTASRQIGDSLEYAELLKLLKKHKVLNKDDADYDGHFSNERKPRTQRMHRSTQTNEIDLLASGGAPFGRAMNLAAVNKAIVDAAAAAAAAAAGADGYMYHSSSQQITTNSTMCAEDEANMNENENDESQLSDFNRKFTDAIYNEYGMTNEMHATGKHHQNGAHAAAAASMASRQLNGNANANMGENDEDDELKPLSSAMARKTPASSKQQQRASAKKHVDVYFHAEGDEDDERKTNPPLVVVDYDYDEDFDDNDPNYHDEFASDKRYRRSRYRNRPSDDIEEEIRLKMIIKGDEASKKRYADLYEAQCLIFRSLYELRRCIIHNRNITISSDLNNLLMRNFNYDIMKDCKSLKELEKRLEILGIEVTEEMKRQKKRANVTQRLSLNLSPIRSKTLFTLESTSKRGTKTAAMLSYKEKIKSSINRGYRNVDGTYVREPTTNVSDPRRLVTGAAAGGAGVGATGGGGGGGGGDSKSSEMNVAYRSLMPNAIYNQYFKRKLPQLEPLRAAVKHQPPQSPTMVTTSLNYFCQHQPPSSSSSQSQSPANRKYPMASSNNSSSKHHQTALERKHLPALPVIRAKSEFTY